MVSCDGGGHWRRAMRGVVDGHAQELVFSPKDPETLFLLVNPWVRKGRVHVYRSGDGGESWEDIGFPLPPVPLRELAFVDGGMSNLVVHPTDEDILYAGSNGYGVFKTTDGGKHWAPANSGLATPFLKGPNALLIHPTNPELMFASTQQGGVYRSLDGGKTWRSLDHGPAFTFGMALDPLNPRRILVACAEKRILLSEDEGNTWRTIELPGEHPPHVAAYAVAMSPHWPGKVFVGTRGYDFKAAEGVFVSDDGGRSYRAGSMGLPGVSINDLEILGGSECRVLFGFNGIGVHEARFR
jgi:photosystem II stability/assembly factor-like uncharacterized protein